MSLKDKTINLYMIKLSNLLIVLSLFSCDTYLVGEYSYINNVPLTSSVLELKDSNLFVLRNYSDVMRSETKGMYIKKRNTLTLISFDYYRDTIYCEEEKSIDSDSIYVVFEIMYDKQSSTGIILETDPGIILSENGKLVIAKTDYHMDSLYIFCYFDYYIHVKDTNNYFLIRVNPRVNGEFFQEELKCSVRRNKLKIKGTKRKFVKINNDN